MCQRDRASRGSAGSSAPSRTAGADRLHAVPAESVPGRRSDDPRTAMTMMNPQSLDCGDGRRLRRNGRSTVALHPRQLTLQAFGVRFLGDFAVLSPNFVAICKDLWSAVAERSGDNAFRQRSQFPKRRGASLPAAVQRFWLRLCRAAPWR